jgi:hypothetical protein
MAMACFRLVTFLPLRPLLSVPRLRRRIADRTVLLAPRLYFLAMIVLPTYFVAGSVDANAVHASGVAQ